MFEPFESELFVAAMAPGLLVLDIGANIGYYTLLAAAGIGASGRVLAFEPDEENFRVLCRNVAANSDSNVAPYRLAVSDSSDPVNLYLCEGNKGDHRTYEVPGRASVSVSCVMLDSFPDLMGCAPSVIKMDIQGAEMRALQGMRGLASRSEAVALFTEYWPEGLSEAGTEAAEFVSLLTELGFKLALIDEASRSLRGVRTVEEIAAGLGPYGEANLLCTRGTWPSLDQFREGTTSDCGHV
ncbi:MAG: FkbM family methyltransferase [Actinomycetota bacterium]|nr:FkbM family methyltransferase [Actinomycetota bacterium]